MDHDTITTTAQDGITLVRLRGEVDMAVREQAGGALHEVATSGRPVVVDLGDVTFLDSTGVAFLLRCLRVAQEQGVSCVLRAVPDGVARVLRVLGLAEVLGVDGVTPTAPPRSAAAARPPAPARAAPGR